MEILKTDAKKAVTFKLTGNLDVRSSPDLEEHLVEAFAETKYVTLDFKDVAYISSSGLRVILSGDQTAKGKGGRLTITNASAFIMQIFEVTGFTSILHFE